MYVCLLDVDRQEREKNRCRANEEEKLSQPHPSSPSRLTYVDGDEFVAALNAHTTQPLSLSHSHTHPKHTIPYTPHTSIFPLPSYSPPPHTHRYMAPEILSEQPYNEKADVWAVGTIMYCLLGGFNPFEGRSTVRSPFFSLCVRR